MVIACILYNADLEVIQFHKSEITLHVTSDFTYSPIDRGDYAY